MRATRPFDSFHDRHKVSNCIHAVSSVDRGYRLWVISPEWGETASWFVLKRMKPWLLDGDQIYLCIASRLGLDSYPLARRPLENPRTGLMWSAFKTMCGKK